MYTDGKGNFVDATSDLCEQVTANCPDGGKLERLYILKPPGDLQVGGTRCVGGPVTPTTAQITQAVTDEFSKLLLAAKPSHQPDPIAIVNIPTLFAANIDRTQSVSETLLGQRVILNLRASWTWNFGDGATLTTTNAGGAYPNTSLSHTYAQAGKYTVTVTTNWTGTYSVNGGPQKAIPGGAVPRASSPFVVDVHEARAVLVAH